MLAMRPLDRVGMLPVVYYPVLLAAVRWTICHA